MPKSGPGVAYDRIFTKSSHPEFSGFVYGDIYVEPGNGISTAQFFT